jgi:hypothetical protein
LSAVQVRLLLGGVQRGVQQEAGGQSQAAGVDCHAEERSGKGGEGTDKRLHLWNQCGAGQSDDEGEGHGGVLEPVKAMRLACFACFAQDNPFLRRVNGSCPSPWTTDGERKVA